MERTKTIFEFIIFGVMLFSFTCTKKVTESKVPGTGTISGIALLADTSDYRSITVEVDPDNQIYNTVRTNPDSTGFYSVSDLPVGTYAVRGQKYSYTPFEQTGVVVEGGKTTEVDMLLNRATPEFIFAHFKAELYYFVDENSFYCNYCDYEAIFHFENYDGAWNNIYVQYAHEAHYGSFNFLEAGQTDTLAAMYGHGSSSPEGILPPDTTVSVEISLGGLFLAHEGFDTTGAIPFEASTYDTVTVIAGYPPRWP